VSVTGHPRFAAAVFDFGDTLFHSPSGAEALVQAGVEPALAHRLWDELWEASKTTEELARGRDLSAEHHRKGWMALLERLEPHAPGIAPRLYERVIHAGGWLPYPDSAEVLGALRAREVRIGVVSNIPSSLRPIFASHGLDEYVDAYVESFQMGREKPDPALFRAVCRDLAVAPTQALMVGDSHLTDGAAVRVGMAVLLLPAVPPGAVRGLARVLDLCG
jgi:HAD superfamily hydrolase (TIGR01509 family)